MWQIRGHYFFKCFLVYSAPLSVTYITTMIDHRLLTHFIFIFLLFFPFGYLLVFSSLISLWIKIKHFSKCLQIFYYRFPAQSLVHYLVRLLIFLCMLKKLVLHHIYCKYFLFVIYLFILLVEYICMFPYRSLHIFSHAFKFIIIFLYKFYVSHSTLRNEIFFILFLIFWVF